jgi:phosphatidylglycerophosphatase A
MLKNPVHLLALGLGSGLSPKAPGTAGSIVALLLLWLAGPALASWHWFIALVACLVGVPICAYCSKALGGADHKAIVWDEFAGAWLAVMFLPFSLLWWLAAFVLFRLFDIVKPWPIGLADKRVHGGLGIMLDDILAGLITAAILFVVQILVF